MGSRTQRATIDDVAAMAGVSVATVSRALRRLPNVAEPTRARVEQAANHLGYRPDPVASRLAAGRTMTVGVAVSMVGTWYVSQVVAGIDAVLAESGFDLLLFSLGTAESRRRLVAGWAQLSRRVDALVLVDIPLQRDEVRELAAQRSPVVTIGTRYDELSSVTIDDAAGAALATQHLLNQGHEAIAFLGDDPVPDQRPVIPGQRRNGYRRALRRAGVKARPELEVTCGLGLDDAVEATSSLLARRDPPTAVFAMSDMKAFGVLKAARTHGIDVPRDLSVVGFDDHELSEVVDLTTVRQPVEEVGRIAAEWAMAALRDGPGPRTPLHQQLPTSLVVRASTRRRP